MPNMKGRSWWIQQSFILHWRWLVKKTRESPLILSQWNSLKFQNNGITRSIKRTPNYQVAFLSIIWLFLKGNDPELNRELILVQRLGSAFTSVGSLLIVCLLDSLSGNGSSLASTFEAAMEAVSGACRGPEGLQARWHLLSSNVVPFPFFSADNGLCFKRAWEVLRLKVAIFCTFWPLLTGILANDV